MWWGIPRLAGRRLREVTIGACDTTSVSRDPADVTRLPIRQFQAEGTVGTVLNMPP